MGNFINLLKSHLFPTLVFILLIIFIPVVIYLSFVTKNPAPQTQIPTINPHPTPLPSDLTKSYNNFNQLVPGKSTLGDIEKTNGPAISSVKNGNKTYLYYQTPSEDYKNTVVLKNGALYYSLENVFGDYRGFYSDYTTAYGQPTLTLFNKNSGDSEWFIFLKQGLGLEVGGNDITQILYFTPQSTDNFMQNLAPDLNLISLPPEGVPEPLGTSPVL
jgi:hypothetical protein